jgi:hypothetical protein
MLDGGTQMSFERDDWDSIYRRRSLDELPWERGKPREMLVELVESGMIETSLPRLSRYRRRRPKRRM